MRDALLALLEPTVKGMGYELVEVEFRSGPDALLRIYIDGPDGQITLDDCELVSHQVSGLLDVEDPIPGAYSLEVSSPGLDRPLRTAEHFRRFVGERAKIQLLQPREGRRRFTGTLEGVRDEKVAINVDGQDFELPLANIEKARIVPRF
ncbi:MAG: ribosome maturation factor RimP [Gammaproteobacteria bacterium]|jgi:ribosome maturation factor RimP